jgi:hypothetical protein
MATNPISSLTKLFQKYIPDNVPRSQVNVFWMLFNGVDAVVQQIETILKIFKKERNILSANSIASLRNLAAYNGFEPTLKVPATGTVSVKATPKLFNRVGFPLYLPPYAPFINEDSGLAYYYDSNKVLRIDNATQLISLTEGETKSSTQISTGNYIERFYLDTDKIAEGSLSLTVGTENFLLVKSFFDNENVNDNKQFLFKFSNRADYPIVLYVKGLVLNDSAVISYRTTTGEAGNLSSKSIFSTDALLNSQGVSVEPSDEEITIVATGGFELGSNGTDENALRAAIGYNHGNVQLYDQISYVEFINKFSTLLTQKVVVDPMYKTIKNCFVGKKVYINSDANISVDNQYRTSIEFNSHLMSSTERAALEKLINVNEFALSSHNLYDPERCNYAFQFMFDTNELAQQHTYGITNLIYGEFAKFLYNATYSINLEILFDTYKTDNNVAFDWTVFNQLIEATKISKQAITEATPYVISAATGIMPILKGNFPIADMDFQPVQLFFDLNIVSKDTVI